MAAGTDAKAKGMLQLPRLLHTVTTADVTAARARRSATRGGGHGTVRSVANASAAEGARASACWRERNAREQRSWSTLRESVCGSGDTAASQALPQEVEKCSKGFECGVELGALLLEWPSST